MLSLRKSLIRIDISLDATGGRAVETLHLPAAYCVAYQEQFSSGDAAGGVYQCLLTLSDPKDKAHRGR
ncbi:MAG: hypothetical protein EOO60_13865 [Hymenobacter sp.]|nr:MAG: hypothetical protein EOO60_13865 [Hymenobacter sp.]